MILSFPQDRFMDRIISGTKIHTFRTDKTDRWLPGKKVHFWRGNPRNKGSYFFAESRCILTLNARISDIEKGVWIKSIGQVHDLDQLATDDGFDSWEEMKNFFPPEWTGKLIAWSHEITRRLRINP